MMLTRDHSWPTPAGRIVENHAWGIAAYYAAPALRIKLCRINTFGQKPSLRSNTRSLHQSVLSASQITILSLATNCIGTVPRRLIDNTRLSKLSLLRKAQKPTLSHFYSSRTDTQCSHSPEAGLLLLSHILTLSRIFPARSRSRCGWSNILKAY